MIHGLRFVACILLVVTPWPAAAADNAITVYAAASLREAFEAAGPAFTARTGTTVRFDFGGSDTLAAQLDAGAPADVFASANGTQMRRVADAGLLAKAAVPFTRNRLVVIVPTANPAAVNAVADLGRSGVKVVLADPTVPVGSYARAAFSKMGGHDGLPAGFAQNVEANVVSNELDVKAVATKISLGEGDAGVVYRTDVTPAIAGSVHVIDFPRGDAPEARYPIATLKAAPNPSGAHAFIAYLLGDGRQFLKARGFLSP